MVISRLLICGVGAATVVLATNIFLRQRRRKAAARLAKHVKLELLPIERGPVICMSPATSTVTFFFGSAATVEHLFLQRVADIVAANPWLTSVLEHDPESGVMAAYYIAGTASTSCFSVRHDIKLSRSDSYATIVGHLSSALCKTSNESVGTGAPLWQVCLIPDATEPESRFALVVSANHSLLDGHGFYKLYNMLSTGTAVEALSPERKQQLPDAMLCAVGGEPSPMANVGPGFLARFIGAQMWSTLFPSTKSFGFYVSEEWVAASKATAEGVPYVSTNDVLVSSFCNCLQSRCVMMAINFRGKLNGCGEDDVGNYEDLLTYMPTDYATPALIRKSVSGAGGVFSRAAQPRTLMLSNCEHLCYGTYGAITNWSTFARGLSVHGAQQELHLPLFDFPKATPASIFGSMVIFRPGVACSVAVIIAGSQQLIDKVKTSGMVGRPLEGLEF